MTDRILPNPLYNVAKGGSSEDIAGLLGNIIRIVLGFAGIIALLVFVIGGLVLLTSGGASDKIEKGKNILYGGVLGITLVFVSYLLVSFILSALSGG